MARENAKRKDMSVGELDVIRGMGIRYRIWVRGFDVIRKSVAIVAVINHLVASSFLRIAENEKNNGISPIVVTFPTNVSAGQYVRVAGFPKMLGKGERRAARVG